MNAQHTDYRSTIQTAALAFMQRHQNEHLDDEQQLFSRTVNYLILTMNVAKPLAENLVSAAYGELSSTGCKLHLDISASTCHTAVITDPASGLTYAVPVSLIAEHMIKHRRTLRAVR